MLLHIGGDYGVLSRRVVAVLNLEGTYTDDTAGFIRMAREEGFVTEICPPPHKSGVLLADKRGYTLYLSPISAATLAARLSGRTVRP